MADMLVKGDLYKAMFEDEEVRKLLKEMCECIGLNSSYVKKSEEVKKMVNIVVGIFITHFFCSYNLCTRTNCTTSSDSLTQFSFLKYCISNLLCFCSYNELSHVINSTNCQSPSQAPPLFVCGFL